MHTETGHGGSPPKGGGILQGGAGGPPPETTGVLCGGTAGLRKGDALV